MTYQELRRLFYAHEDKNPATHLMAYITFSGFGPGNRNDYPWEGRTYVISSDNKAFQPNKGGYSIFGSSLDKKDMCVRLERFMRDEKGGKDGWVIEDCCIIGYMPVADTDGRLLPQMFYTYDEALRASSKAGKQDVQRIRIYDPLRMFFEKRAAA